MQTFIKCKMNQEHYAKHCGRCQAAGQEKSILAGIFRTLEGEKIQAKKEARGAFPFHGVFIDPEKHQEIISKARAQTAEGGM